MFKYTASLFIMFFVIACLVSVESYSKRVINLNESGVLKMIQKENPGHYQKIKGILDGIYKQTESKIPYWLKTEFNARDVFYGPALLTSLPPKKHISFTLEGTRYEALLTLTDFGPLII